MLTGTDPDTAGHLPVLNFQGHGAANPLQIFGSEGVTSQRTPEEEFIVLDSLLDLGSL